VIDINAVSREDGAGTRGAFVDLMSIEWKGDGLRWDMTAKEATIANKTGIMLMAVSSDEAAIGYVSAGALINDVKALQIDGAGHGGQHQKWQLSGGQDVSDRHPRGAGRAREGFHRFYAVQRRAGCPEKSS